MTFEEKVKLVRQARAEIRAAIESVRKAWNCCTTVFTAAAPLQCADALAELVDLDDRLHLWLAAEGLDQPEQPSRCEHGVEGGCPEDLGGKPA